MDWVERLRASVQEHANEMMAAGLADGKLWVEEVASFAELRRLASAVDGGDTETIDPDPPGDGSDAGDPPAFVAVAQVLTGDELDDSDAMDYWENAVDDSAKKRDDIYYLGAFIVAALARWREGEALLDKKPEPPAVAG